MKKLLTILLALTLVTTLGLSAFATAAPDVPGTAAIEFLKGALVIDPTIPTDPAHPLFGMAGGNMIFKTFKITGDNATHTVLVNPDGITPATEEQVGLTVNDARGDGANWTASVKAGAFTAGIKPSLANYTLTLTAFGVPKTSGAGSNSPVVSAGPHILTGGGAESTLLTADGGGSQGKWAMEYTPVLDTIGGSEVVGANSATVTWTVSSV